MTLTTIKQWCAAKAEPVLTWLDELWLEGREAREVVFLTRFSFFVVLVTVGALLLNDQGREIAVRGGDQWSDLVSYPVATFWLAFQVWFWARTVLGDEKPRTRDEASQKPVVTHFPRILGIVCCLIPIFALGAAAFDGQAGEHVVVLIVALVATLFVFLLFVVYRRAIDQKLRSMKNAPEGENLDAFGHPYNVFRRWLSYVVSALLLAIAWWDPALFTPLGAAPVLMLGLASIIPFGSRAVLAFRKRAFPVVTGLVVSGVLLSSCDPHDMRELGSIVKDDRPTIQQEFDRWEKSAAGTDKTLVVVAAAGGGITAAYWTASVLGQIAEADPKFASRLFSISSVSGGSVGTVAYTQSLGCAAASAETRRLDVERSLGGDLLTPTLTTLLFKDLVFWFPGFSTAAHYGLNRNDRAVSFERQFERQWRETFPGCEGLDSSFLAQRAQAAEWRPLVFLNSTHQETGQPVVMSQVKLDVEGRVQPFETAIDLFAFAQRDLRLSTAALNSARFPFVSPAGRIPYRGKDIHLELGHLIDGGYFENDGAFTTLKLLETLGSRLDGVRVVVIQISIDSPRPLGWRPPVNDSHRWRERSFYADRVAHQPHSANEVLNPVYGLMATRDAHQLDARTALRRWTLARGADGHYVHLRALIPSRRVVTNPATPPLGWLLSQASQDQLSNTTLCLDRNAYYWTKLSAALGVPNKHAESCGDSKLPLDDVDRVFPP